MGDAWGLFLLMVVMVGAMVVMTRGPRRDRGNWHDLISAQGRPDGNLPTAILFLAACSVLMGSTSHLATGVVLGVGAALLASNPLGRSVMSVVGAIAAVVVGVTFVTAPAVDGLDWMGTVAGRLLLLAFLLACFVAGAMSGVMFGGRSLRSFSLGKGRSLAFFGLIEFLVFIASPGGLDFFALSQDELVPLLAGGTFVAFAFGALAGQFTLFLAAVGLLVATAGLSMMGLSVDPRAAPDLGMMLGGAIGYAAFRGVSRKFFG